MRTRPTPIHWFVVVVLHRVPFLRLRRCLKKVERCGLDLSFDQLVSHHLAGGRIESWVDGLVYAREHGVAVEAINGAARDLIAAQGSGISLTEHIQIAIGRGCRNLHGFPFDSLQK